MALQFPISWPRTDSKPPRARFNAAFAICAALAAFNAAAAESNAPPEAARAQFLKRDLNPMHDPALKAWTTGDWNRLIGIASEWALLEPANPAAWRYLGDGYFGVHAMGKAATAYHKALDLEATAALWESIGESHLWQGIFYQSRSVDEPAAAEFEHALAAMNAALALDPNYRQVIGAIGAIRYHQQALDRALAALEGHVVAYPDDARSWHYLGMTHAEMGDHASAVTDFRAAVELTRNPLAQLRNWLLLRQSAERIERADLVSEADEHLERIAGEIRAQREEQLARAK